MTLFGVSSQVNPYVMTETPKKTVTHIRPEKSERIFSISEIWKFRPLLKQLIARNTQTRILNSPITLLWGFIRPGIMTLAFFYIRRMANADFGSGVPYALFIFSGLCLWFLFAEVTVQVAGSISTDASLSRKVYFPRILSPISVVLGRWIDCIVIVAAIVVFQLFMGISISASFPFIILVMATLLLLAFGSGLILRLLLPFTKTIGKFWRRSFIWVCSCLQCCSLSQFYRY